jgi:hypothetical protein
VAGVSELLSIFESTEDLGEAEGALDRIATMERPKDLELGECYDSLAEVAADAGDLELAIRAQRRALEHGCREPDLARQMLGWYLLESGEREEGSKARRPRTLRRLADQRAPAVLAAHPGFLAGLNVAGSRVTNEAVAQDQGREWTAPSEAFATPAAAWRLKTETLARPALVA